ncbi:MAG: hypothetical protein ACRDBX_07335 [Erysipelotrichaceae bacterium]
MSSHNEKKKPHVYFPICIGVGLALGAALNQIPIGLLLGVAIGLMLDQQKKK